MDIRNVGKTDIGRFLAFLAVQEHKFKPRWASVGPSGPVKPTVNPLPPLLCELVAEELLLGQLGLLVDLSQHLVHHAEQRTAQAQQFIQEHIVM